METALQQLVALLGDAVRTDPVSCENYRFDWSRDPTAGVPIAVVRPSDAAEVQGCGPLGSRAPRARRAARAPVAACPAEPRRFTAASC